MLSTYLTEKIDCSPITDLQHPSRRKVQPDLIQRDEMRGLLDTEWSYIDAPAIAQKQFMGEGALVIPLQYYRVYLRRVPCIHYKDGLFASLRFNSWFCIIKSNAYIISMR